jgi:uncharacterized protein
VNVLARRGRLERGGELYGKAFESWVFHELTAASAYLERDARLSHWRLASGIEVDFVVDDVRLAIEAKATARATSDHMKGLRHIAADHPEVERRLLVCLEPKRRLTEDGIEVVPAEEFARDVAAGHIL